MINIGDRVSHPKHGIGVVKFFDGTNIVLFNSGETHSCFDRELVKL